MSYTVSVIVPCFNCSTTIEKVITGLRHQTREPDEIIIVNDASLDNSAWLAQKMGVEVISHNENLGPAAARNTGFKKSSGDILVFVDADTLPDKYMIEELLYVYENENVYLKRKPLGGVGGRGVEIYTAHLPDLWRSIHARQDYGDRFRSNVPFLFGLCCSYKREVFELVAGFDQFFQTSAGEDVDIGFRIRRAGFRLVYNPHAIVYHYHKDDLSSLRRVQYKWTFWNCMFHRRHKISLLKIYLGILRHLVCDTMADLLIRRNIKLAGIDILIFFEKLRALKNYHYLSKKEESLFRNGP